MTQQPPGTGTHQITAPWRPDPPVQQHSRASRSTNEHTASGRDTTEPTEVVDLVTALRRTIEDAKERRAARARQAAAPPAEEKP